MQKLKHILQNLDAVLRKLQKKTLRTKNKPSYTFDAALSALRNDKWTYKCERNLPRFLGDICKKCLKNMGRTGGVFSTRLNVHIYRVATKSQFRKKIDLAGLSI